MKLFKPQITWVGVNRFDLQLDINNARLLRIEDCEDIDNPVAVYRPISKEEFREFAASVIVYGKSPLWYRLLRLLSFSMTKSIYPIQGLPSNPLIGSTFKS